MAKRCFSGKKARAFERGQSSLEALLAFAALLCALALLAHAAKGQTDAFARAARIAYEREILSQEALYIDLSADMVPTMALSRDFTGVPVSGGGHLASNASGAIQEPLFHDITVGYKGGYYVQK
jgi:hypothetical protein